MEEIAKKLEMGTYEPEQTQYHVFNSVYSTAEAGEEKFVNDKFFIQKPFDIKSVEELFGLKYGFLTTASYYFFDENKSPMDLVGIFQQAGLSKEDVTNIVTKNTANRLDVKQAWDSVVRKDKEKGKIINSILEQLTPNCTIVCATNDGNGLSTMKGSSLTAGKGGGYPTGHMLYTQPFFNFNNRNRSFEDYIKNAEAYLKEAKPELVGAPLGHPQIPIVFTKDFPNFRWCFADTAYVPTKNGANFFRFYSKE